MSALLDKLLAKRSTNKFTNNDERDYFAAIVAYLRSHKVEKIQGNEKHFSILFEKYLAGVSLFDAPSTGDFSTLEYRLLYLFHLRQLLAQGRLTSDASFYLASDDQFIQADVSLHSRDLDCALQRLAATADKKSRAFSLAETVLDFIVRKIHQKISNSLPNLADGCQTSLDTLQKEFNNFESTFDWAYFAITVFANLPDNCPAKYASLAEKCRLDFAKIQGKFDVATYLDIWNSIRDEQFESAAWWSTNVLDLLLYIYNMHGSFVFFHNRCHSPSNNDGKRVEGLISTSLRIASHSTFTTDLKSTLTFMLQSSFVRMHNQAESVILARMQQILAAICAIANWTECIDIVSGRGGEGAARLIHAVNTCQLPIPNLQPSFFFRLDFLPTVTFDWSFLANTERAKIGYFTFGPSDFRLQARSTFTKYLTLPVIDSSRPTSTMKLIYRQTRAKFTHLIQCVYFSACNKFQQNFLSVELDNVLKHCGGDRAESVCNFALELAQKSPFSLASFQVDWVHLQDFSIDSMANEHLTAFEEDNLRLQNAQLMPVINERLLQEHEQLQEQQHVTISEKKINQDVANSSQIYHDPSSQINFDQLAKEKEQKKAKVVVESQAKTTKGNDDGQNQEQKKTKLLVDSQATTQGNDDDDDDDKQSQKVTQDNDDDVDDKPLRIASQKVDDEPLPVAKKVDDEPLPVAQKVVDEKPLVAVSSTNAPKPRGRKRKQPDSQSISINLDGDGKLDGEKDNDEFFVTYIAYKPGKKGSPMQQAIVFTYWTKFKDIVIQSGSDCDNQGKKLQEIVGKDNGIWFCFLPFKTPYEAEMLMAHHPDDFNYLDLWTLEFQDGWPQLGWQKGSNLEEIAQIFEQRRSEFLNTWVKTVWLTAKSTYLVHVGNEHLDKKTGDEKTDEFDRLILGSGFLEFPRSIVDRHLSKDQIRDLSSAARHQQYPWKGDGDAALAVLKAPIRNNEPCLKRPDDDFKVRTATYQTLWPKFDAQRAANSMPIDLPSPKFGANSQNRRLSSVKQSSRSTTLIESREERMKKFSQSNDQGDDDEETSLQGTESKKAKTADDSDATFGIYSIDFEPRSLKLGANDSAVYIVRRKGLQQEKTDDYCLLELTHYMRLSSANPKLWKSVAQNKTPSNIACIKLSDFPLICGKDLRL